MKDEAVSGFHGDVGGFTTQMPWTQDTAEARRIIDLFLPPVKSVMEIMVEMKQQESNLFVPGRGEIYSQYFNRQVDHQAVFTAFLAAGKKGSAGTRGSARRVYNAWRYKAELGAAITATENLLSEAHNAVNDAGSILVGQKGSFMHSCAGICPGNPHAKETSMFFAVNQNFATLLFILKAVGEKPFKQLLFPPDHEQFNLPDAGCSSIADGRSNVDATKPIDGATFPFHPSWFDPTLNLFQSFPYNVWMDSWGEPGTHGECKYATDGNVKTSNALRADVMLVYRYMIMQTLSDLRNLHDQATQLSAKLTAVAVTVCTSGLNYISTHYVVNAA